MGIKFLEKIRRHASIASGDFGALFQGVHIPPLPAAAARLVQEINRPEPDIAYTTKLISVSPELAAKVIQTINSSLYSLRSPVLSIRHAISLMGISHLRPIVLAYTLRSAIPAPSGGLFDRDGFWSDSLLRATLGHALARRVRPGEEDSAFTALLIADLALPVLLEHWSEYYRPVVAAWRKTHHRLADIEQAQFRWDHAQAGAWILQSWQFPEELVCMVGFHHRDPDELGACDLADTLAPVLTAAAWVPSCLRPDRERVHAFYESVRASFDTPAGALAETLSDARESFEELRQIFDLPPALTDEVWRELDMAADPAGRAGDHDAGVGGENGEGEEGSGASAEPAA